jgi:hypothetical protein
MNKEVQQQQTFASEFMRLFRSAVDQRAYLNVTYRGKKNEASMRLAIDKLYPYRYTQFSDRTAARFLIENQYTISQVIPAHHHQVKAKLQNLIIVAKQYQQQ